MSKTWETLFNLSSFMKYLLSKDLPNEKLEAPLYVLDSLYDLLTVTSAWIDKIKPVTNINTSLKNQLAEHSAQVILTSRSSKSHAENISQDNTRKNVAVSDFPSSVSLPFELLEKDSQNSKVARMENPSQEIPDLFMNLSKEMINGRPLGYYCRPCDGAFYSKKEWDIHIGDRLHNFLMDREIKYGSCVYCKFIIFASNTDINTFFKYHETEHHSRNPKKFPIKEYISKDETNKIHSKIRKSNLVKTVSDVYSKFDDIDVNYNMKTGQRISPVFIELDKKMHSGQEKGFYCHICNKAFEEVAEWNIHFQEAEIHRDKYDSSGCFEMCDACGLVIFATPSIQKWYKSHHMCGHYCSKEEKKANSNSKGSFESLQSTAPSLGSSQSYKNNAPQQNNPSTGTYKISQQFRDFNEQLHAFNFQGHFFCRPCSAILSPEEWIKHSVCKKHVELMASKKYKNWKGTCTYCSLTIIGTRDTVKFYMEFHSEQHNKVVSYDLHKISSDNTPNNTSFSRPRRKHATRKVASPISLSSMGDEEDGSEPEDKQVNIMSEPSSIKDDEDTSWYTSSREEHLNDSIHQLIVSKTKERYTTGNSSFGGLCTLCECTITDAFDWQDHLSSNEHCDRKTPQDREGYISELNIYLFGNMNVFEKYKSLVKGNWSFV